ncbi:MAG: hypothetical protein WCB86_03545 [Candidatus Dormiibacterota bacterium]
MVEMETALCLSFYAAEVTQQATPGNAELWDWTDEGRPDTGLPASLILLAGDLSANLSDIRGGRATIARGTVFDWRQADPLAAASTLPS